MGILICSFKWRSLKFISGSFLDQLLPTFYIAVEHCSFFSCLCDKMSLQRKRKKEKVYFGFQSMVIVSHSSRRWSTWSLGTHGQDAESNKSFGSFHYLLSMLPRIANQGVSLPSVGGSFHPLTYSGCFLLLDTPRSQSLIWF